MSSSTFLTVVSVLGLASTVTGTCEHVISQIVDQVATTYTYTPEEGMNGWIARVQQPIKDILKAKNIEPGYVHLISIKAVVVARQNYLNAQTPPVGPKGAAPAKQTCGSAGCACAPVVLANNGIVLSSDLVCEDDFVAVAKSIAQNLPYKPDLTVYNSAALEAELDKMDAKFQPAVFRAHIKDLVIGMAYANFWRDLATPTKEQLASWCK